MKIIGYDFSSHCRQQLNNYEVRNGKLILLNCLSEKALVSPIMYYMMCVPLNGTQDVVCLFQI